MTLRNASFAVYFACIAAAGAATAITRGPYVQLAHEAGITVVWRTGSPMKKPQVTIHEDGGKLSLTVDGAAILSRGLSGGEKLSTAPAGTVQYEAKIGGLKPGTAYRYRILDAGASLTDSSDDCKFATHPPIGKPASARIWVVGDSGTGDWHQVLVARAMQQYTTTGKRAPDLYLHVGDMAYGQGTDDQFQKKFFEPYREILRSTVCWASMGNHEGKTSDGKTGIGPFYDAYVCPEKGEAGGVPSGDESFYSFDYGDIHFICLNSYDIDRSPAGKMAKWLVRDLAATKAKWIIGFWHHPPYTKGTHDSDTEKELVEMRELIMPIMENGGVDLVLSGHSHIYERSMLIDGAYATPTTSEGVVLDDGDGNPGGDGAYRKPSAVTPRKGTVAVVTGHGGALGRNSIGISPIMRSIVLDHGSTILDVSGDTLTGVMLDLRGKERDRFAIVKNGEVGKNIIPNPWKPDANTQQRTGEGVLGAPGTIAEANKAKVHGEKNPPQLAPKESKALIPPHANWDYLAGGQQPETEMWTKQGFDPREEGWKSGAAGFGFGDGDDRTELKDMQGKYTSVFIRSEFQIPPGTDLSKIGLVINYDDAFVLYLNGRKLLSKGITKDKGGKLSITKHEASGSEYFPLSDFADVFKIGTNVIALEGHNGGKDSSDLSLDPSLILEIGK
jgi:acid phosphatase type 7